METKSQKIREALAAGEPRKALSIAVRGCLQRSGQPARRCERARPLRMALGQKHSTYGPNPQAKLRPAFNDPVNTAF